MSEPTFGQKTDTELKNLKDNLWHSADILRAGAHLAANKYGQPILGLIFLRYADVLFKQHKAEIDDEYNSHKGTRMEREYKDIAVEKCGFFLPECAYFDYINDAPDDARKAVLAETAATGTSARRMTSTPTPRITPTTSKRTLRSSSNGLQHLNPSR